MAADYMAGIGSKGHVVQYMRISMPEELTSTA